MNLRRMLFAVVSLSVAGLGALPPAIGAPLAPEARPGGPTAIPGSLRFEHVSTWGEHGSGTGRFMMPMGLESVGGIVYVADVDAHSIEVHGPGVAYTLNPTEMPSSSLTGLSSPMDVAVGDDGVLYVADSGNHRIVRMAPGSTTAWGSFGGWPGQLDFPDAIDVGPSGHVYVLELNNARVQEFSGTGEFLRSWGGYGDGAGQFRGPMGLAVGPDGAVYVADRSLSRVTKFAADGAYVRHWAVATGSEPAFTGGIDVGPDGSVYVVDASAGVVRVYSPDGASLGVLASDHLDAPFGVTVASDGAVLVSNRDGSDVVTFRPVLAATEAPRVSGSARLDGTLTATGARWAVPGVSTSYQWLRDSVAITGATSATYRVVAADAGRALSVRVTASRADYPAPVSIGSASVKVDRLAAKVSAKLAKKKKVAAGARAKLTVKVTVAGLARPTGTLVVRDKGRKVTKVALRAAQRGKVTVRLPRLASGRHRLTVTLKASAQVTKARSKVVAVRVRR